MGNGVPGAAEYRARLISDLGISDSGQSISELTVAHQRTILNKNGLGITRRIIDPVDYGVTFDGVTDDTTALNNFFATKVQTNDVVVFPKGATALISGTVTTGIAGIILDGNGSILKLSPSAANATIMLANTGANSTIKNLIVDGSSVTSSTGIRPRGLNQIIFNCKIKNCIAGGIYLQSSSGSNLLISHNVFSGEGYSICTLDTSTISNVQIVDNIFVGGTVGDAIEFNTPNGGASNITVSNNNISGYSNSSASGIGIGMAKVTSAVISNNVISNCGLDGIHIEDASSGISVTGNRVTACGRSGITAMIGAGAGNAPTGLSIIGNTVTGCLLTAGTGGIALEGATALSNCVVSANIVKGCGRASATCYGIDLGSAGVGFSVVGNIVSNTTGSSTAGIRWNGATSHLVLGNRCFDDQGVKTQQYGIRAYGVNSDVLIIGNYLGGNLSGTMDESSISGGSSGYIKRYNRPGGIDNGSIVPIFSGAVTDASFGTVVPTNGAMAIDQTNGRLYFKYGNAWHYVTQTA